MHLRCTTCGAQICELAPAANAGDNAYIVGLVVVVLRRNNIETESTHMFWNEFVLPRRPVLDELGPSDASVDKMWRPSVGIEVGQKCSLQLAQEGPMWGDFDQCWPELGRESTEVKASPPGSVLTYGLFSWAYVTGGRCCRIIGRSHGLLQAHHRFGYLLWVWYGNHARDIGGGCEPSADKCCILAR